MRIYSHIAFFICFLATSLAVRSQNDDSGHLKTIAEGIIRNVLSKVKATDEGRYLLSDVNPNMITFSYDKSVPSSKGWIVRWHIENGTALVPNRQTAKSTTIVVVNENNGIFLTLFVSFEQGDMMEESTEIFHISEHPRMDIGYRLVTYREDSPFRYELHQIVKDEIASIPKLD